MAMWGWLGGTNPGTWDDGGAVARGLLGRVEDRVADARAVLGGAGRVAWVSAAADAYRARVEDGLRVLDGVGGAVDEARDAVLHHTAAAAQAHEQAVRAGGA